MDIGDKGRTLYNTWTDLTDEQKESLEDQTLHPF